jgi:hypothetical protein
MFEWIGELFKIQNMDRAKLRVLICVCHNGDNEYAFDVESDDVLESNLVKRVIPVICDGPLENLVLCLGRVQTCPHTQKYPHTRTFVYTLPPLLRNLLSREKDNVSILLAAIQDTKINYSGVLDADVGTVLGIYSYMTSNVACIKDRVKKVIESVVVPGSLPKASFKTHGTFFRAYQSPLSSWDIERWTPDVPWWDVLDQTMSDTRKADIATAYAHSRWRDYPGSHQIPFELSELGLPTTLEDLLESTTAFIAGGFAAAVAAGPTIHCAKNKILSTSDIDIFLLKSCTDTTLQVILNWGKIQGYTICLKAESVFVMVKARAMSIQIISTDYETPFDLVSGFDYGYCQAYLNTREKQVYYSPLALRDWFSNVAHSTLKEKVRKPDRLIKALAKGYELDAPDRAYLHANLDSDSVQTLIKQVKEDVLPLGFTNWTLPRFGLIPASEPQDGWVIPRVPVVQRQSCDVKDYPGYTTVEQHEPMSNTFRFRLSVDQFVASTVTYSLEHSRSSGFFGVTTDNWISCQGFLDLMNFEMKDPLKSAHLRIGLPNKPLSDQELALVSKIKEVEDKMGAKIENYEIFGSKRQKVAQENNIPPNGCASFAVRFASNTSYYRDGCLTPEYEALTDMRNTPKFVEVLMRPCAASQESCVFILKTVKWTTPLFTNYIL